MELSGKSANEQMILFEVAINKKAKFLEEIEL